LNTVKELECVAEKREQTLAEMAIAWNLRQKEVSSVIVGASRSEQLQNSVNALKNLTFSVEELKIIDKILDDVD
jgi:L-glyceraldehyde 3-phosphate reductase